MNAKPINVLLIEDNPVDVRLIRELLKEEGMDSCRLEHAGSLSAAREHLAREKVDVVLLDLGLPDSQGFETFIRVNNTVPQIPIVILSGLIDEELAARAVREGAQDYWVKGHVDSNLLGRSLRYAIERKLAEQALKKSEERLKEAQQLGRIGNWEFDVENNSLIWSEETYFLYERDLKLGPPSLVEEASYYSPEQASLLKNQSARVIESGQTLSCDFQVNLSSGKTAFYYTIMHPVKNDQDRVIKITGTVQDITERKQAEAKIIEMEALKRVSQAKSELLSNVSHELRTPLAAIKGNIESLIETDVKWSKKQQLDFLNSANKEADRLTLLIRDLLDMSRIDSGKLTLDKHSYQVSEILDSVSRVLSVITAKHQLKIASLPDLPAVQADKVRIGQVITNLTENAAKFSPEGNRIEIEAALKAGNVIISVVDSGIGMPPEVIENIFNRFYQAKAVVEGKTRGTGLGLPICKGIVEAHGGKIWVESQPGKSSKFSFSLPVV